MPTTTTDTEIIGTNPATGTNTTNTQVSTNTTLPDTPTATDTVTPQFELPAAPDFSASTSDIVQNYDPTQGTVQNESTVSGQMAGLLDQANPYIQLAQQRSREQANKAGLLNSSMAAGAGTRAAIEAALPIAQQDASTYFNQQLTNQAAENQFKGQALGADLATQGMENQAGIAAAQTGYQTQLGELSQEAQQARNLQAQEYATELSRLLASDQQAYQLEVQSINHQNTQELMALETTLKEQLAALQQDYALELETLKSEFDIQGNIDATMGSMYADALKSLSNFLSNPDLTAAQQSAGSQSIISNLQAGLNFLAGITSTPGVGEGV